MARELSVGQVADRCGVAVSALHFYEQKGLISSYRTSGNQRRYEPDVLRRISIIKFAQELGISLAEIGAMFDELPDNRTPTRDDWEDMAERWAATLDQRIARLQRLRTSLAYCIGCGCLTMEQCAIYNPQDRLGAEGKGPRKLLAEDG